MKAIASVRSFRGQFETAARGPSGSSAAGPCVASGPRAEARRRVRFTLIQENPMPANQGAVMPMIAVPSVDKARDFYVEKLGFEHQMAVVGKDGQLDFVNVTRGGASLMFARAPEPPPAVDRQTVEFYVTVQDVDAVFAEVGKRGVPAAEPLTDQWWGDRTFVVSDPNGYRVWFSTHMKDAVPPPGTKVV
jgi:PhnB protein